MEPGQPANQAAPRQISMSMSAANTYGWGALVLMVLSLRLLGTRHQAALERRKLASRSHCTTSSRLRSFE